MHILVAIWEISVFDKIDREVPRNFFEKFWKIDFAYLVICCSAECVLYITVSFLRFTLFVPEISGVKCFGKHKIYFFSRFSQITRNLLEISENSLRHSILYKMDYPWAYFRCDRRDFGFWQNRQEGAEEFFDQTKTRNFFQKFLENRFR